MRNAPAPAPDPAPDPVAATTGDAHDLPRPAAFLCGVVESVCFLLILSFVVITTMAVVARYILNASLPWSEEMVRFTLLWCVMLGAVVITLKGQHLQMEVVQDALGGRARLALRVLAHLATLAFAVVLLVQGWALVQRSTALSPALRLPMWTIHLAMPVGAVGIGLGAMVRLWVELRGRAS